MARAPMLPIDLLLSDEVRLLRSTERRLRAEPGGCDCCEPSRCDEVRLLRLVRLHPLGGSHPAESFAGDGPFPLAPAAAGRHRPGVLCRVGTTPCLIRVERRGSLRVERPWVHRLAAAP